MAENRSPVSIVLIMTPPSERRREMRAQRLANILLRKTIGYQPAAPPNLL